MRHEVDERYHGYGEQYLALIQNHASIFPNEDGRREKVDIKASYASRFSRHNELDASASFRATHSGVILRCSPPLRGEPRRMGHRQAAILRDAAQARGSS